LDVKNTRTVLIGTLVTAITVFAFITPAAAQFTHPNGILMATYPQNIVVFGGAPGDYQETISVAIKPPWYFVPGLMGFTSVSLTLTLAANCYDCLQYGSGNPITLAGANNGQEVIQLGPATMTEDMNGIMFLCPITFVIDSSTASGYYMLFLNAQAVAADGTTFLGWTQIPVAIVRV
jgi:quinol-cytochrome oxidoreductase complex cytochrome b subunit